MVLASTVDMRRALSWRVALRAVILVAVAALAVAYRHTLAIAARQALDVGWLAAAVLPLFCVWNLAAAMGWRATLPSPSTPPSVLRLTLVRIEAQALNLLLPLASVPGDVLRASLLAAELPDGRWRGATSVALDTAANISSALLFSLLGVGVWWAAGRGDARALILVGALLIGWLAFLELLPALVVRLARSRRVAPDSSLGRVLAELAAAPVRRRSLRRATLWHLLERALTAVEIAVLARGLGVRLGPWGALFSTALMTAFTLVFAFVPAQAGAVEGALSIAFGALGYPTSAGLGVALVRRGRQLLSCGLGLLLLAFERRRKPADLAAPSQT